MDHQDSRNILLVKDRSFIVANWVYFSALKKTAIGQKRKRGNKIQYFWMFFSE